MAESERGQRLLDDMLSINSAAELVDFYVENGAFIPEERFLELYFKLAGDSTSDYYGARSKWYTNRFVLPILEKRAECLNEYIQSQGRVETGFIEKELLPGCTLLEVGCGPGRIPALFGNHPHVKEVVAFDSSQKMVDEAIRVVRARKMKNSIRFLTADARELPELGLAPPVIATCVFGTYGNIPRKADRIRALERLKSNVGRGKILVSVFDLAWLGSAMDYYRDIADGVGTDVVRIQGKDGQRAYFLSPSTKFFSVWFSVEGLREEFEAAGLNPEISSKGKLHLVRCVIE